MKHKAGVLLIVLAFLLYLLGVIVVAKEVHYSMSSLWFTLTNSALLGSFIASALGALAPGAIMHYISYRLMTTKKATAIR